MGGCHCRSVRYEVNAPATLEITDCNCSVCKMTGYLHLIVPKKQFRLIQGEKFLSAYEFNTKIAKHFFCKKCGIKSFYVPRSHPDGISVNVRCLDEGLVEATLIKPSNGKEWEKAYPKGRGEFSN